MPSAHLLFAPLLVLLASFDASSGFPLEILGAEEKSSQAVNEDTPSELSAGNIDRQFEYHQTTWDTRTALKLRATGLLACIAAVLTVVFVIRKCFRPNQARQRAASAARRLAAASADDEGDLCEVSTQRVHESGWWYDA